MTPELEDEYASAKERTTRLGRPDDIAAMVAFLCSDDGEWINGQTIAVDGGATMR
jgi:NAD(P)-dependent dehydrogenase (short-subunit alcohol dehydrogenase family)